jgi:uncharacterized OB-fold protein
MTDAQSTEILSAPHALEYDYKRSVGPVLGRFFTELRDRKLVGSKTADGRVHVPPMEYDPATGADVDEIVDVGPGGSVTSWCWVVSPLRNHPLDQPFAFALILLDGADTAMLHAVDAGDESKMATGMRVVPRWSENPTGSILDLACFEPEEA